MKSRIIYILFAITLNGFSQTIPDIKVCMPFNGNANDMSGNNNDGTVNGAMPTTDRFNTPNSAYWFDGTDDFIAIDSFNTIISQNELTISLWAKADQVSSNCMLMLSPDDNNDRCVACAHYTGGYIIWDYGDITGGGRTILSGYPYESKWDHYVFSVSQSGNTKQIYKNGVLIANDTYKSSLIDKTRTLLIGAGTDANPGSIRFNGSIDDVFIFDRAIDSLEVVQLYNGYSCVDTTYVPVVCLPMCGDANDYSGNNHHGIINGAVPAADRFNNPNCAYWFDGDDDNITLEHFDSIAPDNELTISLWAKADQASSNCMLMLSPDDNNDRCVACAHYTGGYIIWDYGDITGSNGRTLLSGYTFQSQWDHYVFVVSQNSNRKEIYKNGIAIHTGSYQGTLMDKSRDMLIGAGTDSNPGNIRFNGYIDDVLIYNQALPASEIYKIYQGYSCQAVAIEKTTKAENINMVLYPNPSSSGIFSINIQREIPNATLTIMDLYGRTVYAENNKTIKNGDVISLKKFASGVYFLKISSPGVDLTQKIIIN